MAEYFPLFVNLEHKRFFVFGAGEVAVRRIQALARHGADITVAAPDIREEIRMLQEQHRGQIQIEQRPYRMGELQSEDTDFVLAATNDMEANTAIYRECRRKKIPVNDASNHRQCDFYFPALAYKEHLFIGMVSTYGSHKETAAASAKLRQESTESIKQLFHS